MYKDETFINFHPFYKESTPKASNLIRSNFTCPNHSIFTRITPKEGIFAQGIEKSLEILLVHRTSSLTTLRSSRRRLRSSRKRSNHLGIPAIPVSTPDSLYSLLYLFISCIPHLYSSDSHAMAFTVLFHQ